MSYNVIKHMKDRDQSAINNDYAVAKVLNEKVMGILVNVVLAYNTGSEDAFDIKELNRSYVLLTGELQKLYEQNTELANIKPEPIWKLFDVIKTSTWDINEYLEDPSNDIGQAHIARIERLCILTGKEVPEFTPEQQELIEYVDKVRICFGKKVDDAYRKNKEKKESYWSVPEYRLTFKVDGTILINDILKLKKVHAGSSPERLMEQALKSPNTLFKPDLGQTSRNISTVISSAGFTPTLRDIFFPTVSNNKGIIFRTTVTRKQVDDENIDTSELDLELKKLTLLT